MGKYMRKCTRPRKPAPAAGVGVKTRAAAKASASVPKRMRKAAPEPAEGIDVVDGCAYIQLRSRRLFLSTSLASSSSATAEAAGSGCSSVASSTGGEVSEEGEPASRLARSADIEGGKPVDVESSIFTGAASAMATATARRGGLSPASSDRCVEHLGELDSEATARPPIRPPAAELEAFFVAAEREQAERFKAKYNFDVVAGVPLGGGRFEWAPLVSG